MTRQSATVVIIALWVATRMSSGQTVLYDFETGSQGWGSYGTVTTDSGETFDGSVGFGRFHIGDFSMDDLDPGNPLLWGIVDVSPLGIDLAPYIGFTVDARMRSIPGFADYTGDRILDVGIEVAGVEYFTDAVTMTDEYQTFTARFSDFVPGSVDRSDAHIKLRVLSSYGMGVGDLNYDEIIGLDPAGGDFNGDSVYDCLDINALSGEIAGGSNNPAFDLTGDGLVDLNDRDAWLVEAGQAELPSGNPYLLGDADLNGDVDVSDFNIWNGSKFTDNSNYCFGDFNASGEVDVSDFNLWNGNKFSSADGVTLVPEPASAGLLLVVFLARLVSDRRAFRLCDR